MDTAVLVAIISALGLIIAALISSYHDDIINMLKLRGHYGFYKGTWVCQWTILSPPPAENSLVQDQVSITRVRGALLKGRGSAPGFGPYRIDGKASEFAATLEYCGENESKDLVGVVILKKSSPRRLDGVWCQYSADGSLKSGTTTWEKLQP